MPAGITPENRVLLGEIEAGLCEPSDLEPPVLAGEMLHLVSNGRDCRAFRADGRPVGSLPVEVCDWLAPLVSRRQLHVECVGATARTPVAPAVSLLLFAPAGILPDPHPADETGLHAKVRRAYDGLQGESNPQRIIDVATALRVQVAQTGLPETRLLLALMSGLAREAQAAQAIRRAAGLPGRISPMAPVDGPSVQEVPCKPSDSGAD